MTQKISNNSSNIQNIYTTPRKNSKNISISPSKQTSL